MKRTYLLLLPLFFTAATSFAQETETQITEKAAKLFDQEQFVEATPLYLRLLALNPRSFNYNYRYGTCLLFNSYKKQDAFKYLTFAVSDPNVSTEAYFYLGKAFHLNYQFNEAIKNYELYKQKVGGKSNPKFLVDRQIEMCQNGKRLLTTISDLVVLEKKEIESADFFRLYNLKNIGGVILVAADFQAKADKKRKYVPIIHFPEDTRKIYYASYGDTDEGQKDIYVRQKLPDGSWSLPQKVMGNVNTSFDEDFPFMHNADGYLYFSSKGHNSMGGYDVYRSKLDPENNTFGPPENMDFAISSPDDDLFFVADSLNQNAYFSSARQSTNGKLFVYKVRVERVPIQLAIVKGEFSSLINPANKKVSIEVTDYASGEKIGTFGSNEKGRYLITFPKGGKYKYVIKVDGTTAVHEYLVNIPFLNEFKPLKQRMREELLESKEVVKVQDLFNEEVEDPQSVLAEVIKMRSELNVNAQNFDLDKLDQEKENKKVLVQIGLENATNQEILTKFETLAQKQEENLKTVENLENGARITALQKIEEIKVLQQEVKVKVALANNAETEKEKYTILKEAEKKINAINTDKQDVANLNRFADSIAKLIPAEQEKATKLANLSKTVSETLLKDDFKAMTDAVIAESTIVKEIEAKKSTDPVQPLLDAEEKEKKDFATLDKQHLSYVSSQADIKAEIKGLEKELETAKTKTKPEIESKIAAKQEELNLVNEEADRLDKKLIASTKQLAEIRNKIDFLQNVSDAKNSAKVAPSEVQAKLDEVDNKNMRALESFVKLQVSDYEKKNGTQANSADPKVIAEESDVKTNEFLKENKAEQEAVDQQADLTAEEKLQLKIKNDQQLLSKLNSEAKKIEQALVDQADNTDLLAQKAKIEQLKEKTTATIQENKAKEAELASNQNGGNTTVAEKPTKEQLVADLYPNYSEEKKNVDPSDPKARLEALTAIDERLLDNISEEKQKVAAVLAKNPEDKNASAKQDALNELEAKTKSEIENRKEALAVLNQNGGNTTVAEKPTKEQLLADLYPNYSEEKKNVDPSDPKARLEALTAIDERLLDNISEEKQKVAAVLAKNPEDKNASAKQDALNELEAKTKSEIENRKEALAVLNQNGGNTTVAEKPTKEQLLADLYPNYSEEKKNVDPSDPKARLEALTAIDERLLDNISEEKQKVAAVLAKNPEDKNASAKQDALNELEAKTKSEIENRKEALATLNQNGGNTTVAEKPTKEQLLADLYPNYSEEKKNVDPSDPKARLEALTAIDERLLDNILEEKQKVVAVLAKNPEDKNASAKQEALNELEAKTKSEIENRKEALAALNQNGGNTTVAEKQTKEQLVAALFPDYEQRKGVIGAFTPSEQVKEANELDQSLINKIEEREAQLNERIAQNPDDSEAKAELEQLSAVKSDLKKDIADRTQEPLSSTSITALKSEIRPNYAQNVEKIEASSKPDAEKALALVKEEAALLDAIDTKLESSTKQLTKTPNDPEIKKENAQLIELQAIQEARVSELKEDLVSIEKAKIDPSVFLNVVDPAYSSPNITEQANWTEQDVARYTENEKILQEKLLARLNKNTAVTEKTFDPVKEAENKVIVQLMEESVNRAQNFKEGTPAETIDPELITESLVNAYGEEARLALEQKATNKTEAQNQLAILKKIETDLVAKQKELVNSDNNEAKKEVNESLKVVRKRIGVIKIDLEEFVRGEVFASANSPEEKELIALKEQEKDINEQLKSADPKTKKELERELLEIKKDQAKVEVTILKKDIQLAETQKENELEKLKASNSSNSDLSAAVVKRMNADKTPDKKSETPESLAEQKVKAENDIALLQAVNAYNEGQQLTGSKEEVLQSETALQAEKRRFSIEIGQIEAEQQALSNSKKDSEKQVQLTAQKQVLINAVNTIDKQLNVLAEEQKKSAPFAEAKQTPISYTEEADLAQEPLYKELSELNAKIIAEKGNENALQAKLNQKRLELSNAKSDIEKQEIINEIVSLSDDLKESKARTALLVSKVDERIASSTEDPMKWKNLLARDIASIALVSAVSLVTPELASGFEIKNNPEVLREKSILVGVKAPSGLVYRVQVGAFAKPIPEKLFTEFTPVTGEKLNNGITRYLAGYFGDRTKVVNAQKQIRNLGYGDAFVVAYCDGERISLAEARRLEDQGLCVPKNQDSLLMDVAASFVEKMPEDSLRKNLVKAKVKPTDYNKAPGAAPAEAIEEKLGLFYTVQIGVYNRPVTNSEIREIKPLITLRLENGQIRYSSGVYKSIDAARPKKDEARLRGISDAFITAYYKGERITLVEAQKLLDQNGPSILEGYKATEVAPEKEVIEKQVEKELKQAEQYAELNPVPEQNKVNEHIQLVSKKTFTEYPRDVVNRFNAYGSFYFDESDGKVKSVEYPNKDVLPRVYYIRNDIDTVYNVPTKSDALLERTSSVVVARFASQSFTALTADWLLRCNLSRFGKLTEAGIEITFDKVFAEKLEQLQVDLKRLGASEVFVKEDE